MSSRSFRYFNVLIRHGIDDYELYRCAAAAVVEPGLRAVLGENAESLARLVADLQSQLRADGLAPATHGSFGGAIRRWLGPRLGWIGSPHDQQWIGCLRRGESELLHAVERGIAILPADAGLVLSQQLPRLYGIHSDMSMLAQSVH